MSKIRVFVAILFGKLWSFHSASCGNEKSCSVWEYADTLQKCENNCNFAVLRVEIDGLVAE